jgi:hypothetical protein
MPRDSLDEVKGNLWRHLFRDHADELSPQIAFDWVQKSDRGTHKKLETQMIVSNGEVHRNGIEQTCWNMSMKSHDFTPDVL